MDRSHHVDPAGGDDPQLADPAAPPSPEVVVIGAGPAGLTAAYMLSKRGHTATILEADDVVGGISRTVERDGWRFDIGGHRFFTKVGPVDDLWFEILGEDEFLRRPRMSRIYYKGKLYDYPIKPVNALRNLGFVEAVRCVLSYLWVRVRPPRDQSSLEGYIAKNYGWRLYRHFFKTYSEKVWGVPTDQISADWGGQRIKGMSLFRAVWEPLRSQVFRRRRDRSQQVTSLIEEFNYPKYGPGQMWEKAAELLRAMDPPPPPDVIAAADGLTYRDFMTVALVVPQEYSFPDNWIYIHDPEVKVGRIQNFGSWSPYLVKEGRTCLGLEFFVNEGDAMWTKPDADLVEQAKDELQRLGLGDASRVEAGYVVRIPKAYPVYDEHYSGHVEVLRRWLDGNAPNVFPVGRNGMHRYNNQDHSMFTAMLSVENVFGAHHDVWSVNVEEEYHEETSSPEGGNGRRNGTGRDAPVLPRDAIENAARARAAGESC